jgi:hypothetical protein
MHNKIPTIILVPCSTSWYPPPPLSSYYYYYYYYPSLPHPPSSSSSSSGPVSLFRGCTSALGLLCNPKYSNQYRFSNRVPLIKRHRSLTEAVLTSFGSTSGFPKTLYRWRANASQQSVLTVWYASYGLPDDGLWKTETCRGYNVLNYKIVHWQCAFS